MRAPALARAVAILGAVAIGAFLCRASPREVTLVYDVSAIPGATGLDVEIRRGGELVRRAELRLQPAGAAQIREPVRLPEGRYDLELRVAVPSGSVHFSRTADVTEDGPIVLPLTR